MTELTFLTGIVYLFDILSHFVRKISEEGLVKLKHDFSPALRKRCSATELFWYLEPEERIELSAYPLPRGDSTTELFRRFRLYYFNFFKSSLISSA